MDWLRALDPLVIYAVIALLSLLESAALTGLFIPGDTALLVAAAVIVGAGGSPVLLVVAAAGGAIIGDSVGYEIGRALRHRDHGRLQRMVASPAWARAEAMVERHGALAIIGGRFLAVIRTVVPVAAGSSAMRYRRFLAANAVGAVLWATVHVAIGRFAGESIERVEGASRYASGVVIALVVAAIVVRSVRHRSQGGVTLAEVEDVVDLRNASFPSVAAAGARVSTIGGGASVNSLVLPAGPPADADIRPLGTGLGVPAAPAAACCPR